VAGLSMGGFHAMHISRYYPNTFDYIGLFSAALMTNNNNQQGGMNVYQGEESTLIAQKNNGYKLYWIGIGKEDFLYQNNVDFRAKLDAIGMKYEYMETDGGHIWKNWRIYLSVFMPKLFQ